MGSRGSQVRYVIYKLTYLHTYLLTYLLACLLACLLAYLLTYSCSSCSSRTHKARQYLTSSLCLGLSFTLCPISAQHPPVPSALDTPCLSLQLHLPWTVLAALSKVIAATSISLCLGFSLQLCPRSAQQLPVPSALSSPCHCASCQPSNL